jgi:TPR repeat protein
VKWATLAANEGHAQGQYILGRCYIEGVGVERDVKEAERWLLAAAENDNQFIWIGE